MIFGQSDLKSYFVTADRGNTHSRRHGLRLVQYSTTDYFEVLYDMVVKKFTFAISSPDEFLYIYIYDNVVTADPEPLVETGKTLDLSDKRGRISWVACMAAGSR